MERLRMVARAVGEDPALVAREAASALAPLADEPAALVTACQRLVERQPTCGPLWWLAARVLAAADPATEAWHAADELWADPTPAVLAAHLPAEAVVVVVGGPDQVGEALARRGDVSVLAVDSAGAGRGLVGHLRRADTPVTFVDASGLGTAVAHGGLVLLEATAAGPDGFIAATGSRAAAAVAAHARIAVWLVAGAGRFLPGPLWDAMSARVAEDPEPWDRDEEVVPLDLVDRVVGPGGLTPLGDAVRRADCPAVPELPGRRHG